MQHLYLQVIFWKNFGHLLNLNKSGNSFARITKISTFEKGNRFESGVADSSGEKLFTPCSMSQNIRKS
jgi:hypothetical protein